MDNLLEQIDSIYDLDSDVVSEVKDYVDKLSKPIGSLGTLEDIVIRMSGIKGRHIDKINKKTIVIMCSDNGICDEGVSSCPKDVTAGVMQNFIDRTTGVCRLSTYYKSDLTIVDIGVDKDFESTEIINRKIRKGTSNCAKGPAMTRGEALKAISIGIDIVRKLKEEGYDLIGTGEMGVGNTSTSAAVISVLSGIDSNFIVGKGSGLTDEGLAHKREVIKRCIEINKPDKNDVIDVMAKVGGFDIAGLCGVFLGGAIYRIPIVIDGLITSAAALCAKRLNPKCAQFMFASHLSAEPGAGYAMKELGLTPMLNLKMRLGEGSGCPLAFGIIESAIYAINTMDSFEQSGIDMSNYIDIRNQ